TIVSEPIYTKNVFAEPIYPAKTLIAEPVYGKSILAQPAPIYGGKVQSYGPQVAYGGYGAHGCVNLGVIKCKWLELSPQSNMSHQTIRILILIALTSAELRHSEETKPFNPIKTKYIPTAVSYYSGTLQGTSPLVIGVQQPAYVRKYVQFGAFHPSRVRKTLTYAPKLSYVPHEYQRV
uniref:Uncharacterized protein n=1 Tax=Anopheles melas TaxID=34690 RepID=A0A182U1M6_9DIPT